MGGTRPDLRVQARRGETWPKESDSGTIRNSRRPGAFGQPSTTARLLVPWGRRSPLGGAAGPGGLGPRAVGARPRPGNARHVAGSLPGPPPPPQGPPLLDQVQARAPRRAAHSVPPPVPSPSLYSAPSRLFTLPLSLSHHLVYTLPSSPPSQGRAPKSPGSAHLSDPNVSAMPSTRRRLAPGSLPVPHPSCGSLCSSRPHGQAPHGALATVVK